MRFSTGRKVTLKVRERDDDDSDRGDALAPGVAVCLISASISFEEPATP